VAGTYAISGTATADYQYALDVDYYSDFEYGNIGSDTVGSSLQNLVNMMDSEQGFNLSSNYYSSYDAGIDIYSAPGLEDPNRDEWVDWIDQNFPDADDESTVTVILADFGVGSEAGRCVFEWNSDEIGGSFSVINGGFEGYSAKPDFRAPIAQHEVFHAFGAEHNDGTHDTDLQDRLNASVMAAGYTYGGPWGNPIPGDGNDFRGKRWEQGLYPDYTMSISDATVAKVTGTLEYADLPDSSKRFGRNGRFFDSRDF
jgi:hypothetical protein